MSNLLCVCFLFLTDGDFGLCRHLEELSSKTQDFEQLLKDLENVVDGRAAERIKRTLAKV